MAKPKSNRSSPPVEIIQNGPTKAQPIAAKKALKKTKDYSSEGVENHDVFELPSSDIQALITLTLVGAVVRLFRIYQPSSVVFDEVQYVISLALPVGIMLIFHQQLRWLRV
jgi:dolichyl-phosphate-mannose-protein mannosyltransferase